MVWLWKSFEIVSIFFPGDIKIYPSEIITHRGKANKIMSYFQYKQKCLINTLFICLYIKSCVKNVRFTIIFCLNSHTDILLYDDRMAKRILSFSISTMQTIWLLSTQQLSDSNGLLIWVNILENEKVTGWSKCILTRNLTEWWKRKRKDIWYDDKLYENDVCTGIDRKK